MDDFVANSSHKESFKDDELNKIPFEHLESKSSVYIAEMTHAVETPKSDKLIVFDMPLEPLVEEGIILNSYQDIVVELLMGASLCHDCVVERNVSQTLTYHGPSPDEIAICKGSNLIGCKFLARDSEGRCSLDMFGEERNPTIKMTFEFDSERKRHSVIVEEHGVYKLYIKGADSEVIKRLYKPEEQPYLEVTQMALDDFSRVGLRTLVFAVRVLTSDQYLLIQEEYQKAVQSTERKKRLKALAEKVENNLFLLGCTAIEDNLQEKVPESIQRFLEANIKVWMITGDKFETAENIAACAGLTEIYLHL